MRTLGRASAGYLWRHPFQLALALLGIATGVAVIVAVDLANGSARRAFELSMDTLTGAASHQVVGGPAGIPDRVYTRLRVDQGFAGLAPVVSGEVTVAERQLQLLGVDPFAEREFRDLTAAATADGSALGDWLTVPGSVLLPRGLADELGIAPGASVPIEVDGRSVEALLAGYLDAGRGADSLVVTDIANAQDWLDQAGRLTRIDVRADRLGSLDALRDALPRGVQLLAAAGRTRAVLSLSDAFAVNLRAMSLLALLVGVFLVYNAMSFAVLQRRPLLATLRALGLRRRGVLALILGEAAVLGLVGGLLGLVAGSWLGNQLLRLVARSINDLYFRVSVTSVQLDPLTLALGFGAGLAATLLAAALPAVEAARQPPRLAMNRIGLEQKSGRLAPRLALTGIAAALLAVPLLFAWQSSLVLALGGLFCVVFGLALTVPWCVRRTVPLLAAIAGRIAGGLARSAVAGIAAGLSRSGVAIVALAVAVSATIGVSIMVGSFRTAVASWVDNTLQADLYVSAADGSLSPGLVGSLLAVDGIAEQGSSRRVWVESPAGRTRLVALETTPAGRAGTELLDAGPDAWQAFLEQGAVLVSESWAFRHDAGAGDTLRLHTDRGERTFRIAATFRSYDANPATVLMNRRYYDTFWDDDDTDSLAIRLTATATAAEVRQALVAAAGGRRLSIRSNDELRDLSLRIFDQTFVITRVLYWLAIAVAVVGIVAALLALQLERRRELATLRALGMTRGQVGGLLGLQSAVIGLFSGLAAMPIGLAMAALLVHVINRRAFGWSMDLQVPASTLAEALLLAVAAALVGGLLPAVRAGRERPALAMRED